MELVQELVVNVVAFLLGVGFGFLHRGGRKGNHA